MTDQCLAPFRGLLPRGRVEVRTAPPYDVIDGNEAARLRALDPENIVRVDLPSEVEEASLGDASGTPAHDADSSVALAHERAAELLSDWVERGSLVVDPRPALYVYRQTFAGPGGAKRTTAGVVGALRIGADGVLPHEQTTAKAKSDRLESLRRTQTNISMIYALSPAPDLTRLVEGAAGDEPAVVSVTDEDGVEHSLWRVGDPGDAAELAAAVDGSPLVIADGHHRYTVAGQYAEEHPDSPAAARIMTFVVPLDPEVLVVRPIHRLLPETGCPADRVADILSRLGVVREVDLGGMARDRSPDGIVVATAAGSFGIRPVLRPEDEDALAKRPESIRSLAVSWTHDVLLPALGAADAVFHHDSAFVLDRVRHGEASAAVLLPAITVDDIIRVADAGERMPPKTTFFWPKARTGLILRRFCDQEDGE